MNKKLNILITGCGGDIGQSIGKILLKSNFINKLYGIDISNKNAGQFVYPNFSLGLSIKHPDYLKNLELFINKYDIDLVIPISEPELRFFSTKNILDKIGNAKMIIASRLSLEIGFDKFKTAEFLKNQNFSNPLKKIYYNYILKENLNSIESVSKLLKKFSNNIHLIKLISPMTSKTRSEKLLKKAKGFVYYIHWMNCHPGMRE